jgi:hypothetical protein
MSAPSIKFGMLRNRSRLRPALGMVLAVAAYMPCALAKEAAPQAGAPNPQLEEVLVIAGGIKTAFLDKRLQINLAVYDAEYKDLQTEMFRTEFVQLGRAPR